MNTLIILLAAVGAWFLLAKLVFPKLGIKG